MAQNYLPGQGPSNLYYKTNQPPTQAHIQAGQPTQAHVQAGIVPAGTVGSGTSGGMPNLSATNPLAINIYPGVGPQPSANPYDANPYIADYSDPNIFSNPNIWTDGYTPSTSPQGGTSQPSGTGPAPIPRQMYRAEIPWTEDFQTPPWADQTYGGRYVMKTVRNPITGAMEQKPFWVAYSGEQIPGGVRMANPNYDPEEFIKRDMGALNYQPTDVNTLLNSIESPMGSLLDQYERERLEQQLAMDNMIKTINEMTTGLGDIMQPKDIEIPEVSSTGLDLPPGFRPLPMPPEYYGYAAQNAEHLPGVPDEEWGQGGQGTPAWVAAKLLGLDMSPFSASTAEEARARAVGKDPFNLYDWYPGLSTDYLPRQEI